MDIPWFYASAGFATNDHELDETSAKHAVQVLRMRENDAIKLTDGQGRLAEASIKIIDKKKCIVAISAVMEQPRMVKRKTAIAISPLKNNNRFEWFLEKATELGIAEIFPIICHRTVREHFRHERLNAICISAMLQSQQTWLPVLQQPQPLKQLINQQSPPATSGSYHHKWIAHCAELEKHHLSHTLQPGMHDSLLLIGPEGDFTNEEIVLAETAGFSAVSLGETRLRTETAGVVGATLLCLMP